MALILKQEHTTNAPSGSNIFIADSTGSYDSVTNIGGYGTPNPTRASKALCCYVALKKTTGDVDVTQNVNNSTIDPTSVGSFVLDVTSTKDGVYESTIIAADIYNSSTGYSAGKVAYWPSSETFRLYNGTSWADITISQVFANKDIVAAGLIFNTKRLHHMAFAINEYNDLVKDIGLYFKENDGCDDCFGKHSKYDEMITRENFLRLMIYTSCGSWTLGNYMNAQEAIEAIHQFNC